MSTMYWFLGSIALLTLWLVASPVRDNYRRSIRYYGAAAIMFLLGLIYVIIGKVITSGMYVASAADLSWFVSGMILMFFISPLITALGVFVYGKFEMNNNRAVVRARNSLQLRASARS